MAAINFPSSPSDGDLYSQNGKTWRYSSAQTSWLGLAGTGAAAFSFDTYRAASLEPLAIEPIQYTQSSTFTYVIAGGTTKMLLASWQTRLGGSGRYERRAQDGLLTLRNVTLTGTAAGSIAAIIDPALPTYTDALDTYQTRLDTIATADTKYLPLTAAATFFPLLPGPYGSVITHQTVFNLDWLAISGGLPYAGGVTGFGLMNELGDSGTDWVRSTSSALVPVSKFIMSGVLTGASGGVGTAEGSVSYIICPSSWGAVTDPLTYTFRDDFMGATLDTSTVWTRSQSTAGNVEINTNFAWCKTKGNGVWGTNGIHTQTGITRAAGTVFLVDVYIDKSATGGGGNAPNLMVGWSDGAGQADTNFSHGLDFTTDGAGALNLFVFENGSSRGQVGAAPGFTAGCIYRVRITLDSPTANKAKYEIQGGPEYGSVGGSSWTDVTPGTTSSSTTPVYPAASVNNTPECYIGDVRVYS